MIIKIILTPLSWVYGLITGLRNLLYDHAILPVYHPDIPVIVVGNLIAGGTCTELEKIGMTCDITPPTIMFGGRSRLSTLSLPRYVIPLHTDQAGDLSLHVAVAVA